MQQTLYGELIGASVDDRSGHLHLQESDFPVFKGILEYWLQNSGNSIVREAIESAPSKTRLFTGEVNKVIQGRFDPTCLRYEWLEQCLGNVKSSYAPLHTAVGVGLIAGISGGIVATSIAAAITKYEELLPETYSRREFLSDVFCAGVSGVGILGGAGGYIGARLGQNMFLSMADDLDSVIIGIYGKKP